MQGCAQTVAAGANGSFDAAAANDQLVGADLRAVGEQHGLIQAALNEQFAADSKHVGKCGADLAPQAGFILQQAQRVVAGGGGHAGAEGIAPVVDADAEIGRAQRDAGDAAEGYAARRLHRIALGDCARGTDFVPEQDGTAPVGQRRAGAAQGQAAADVFQADGDVADGGAVFDARGVDELERAGDRAQPGDGDGAAGDGEFLARDAVSKHDADVW